MNLSQRLLTKSYCYLANMNKRNASYTTFRQRGPLGVMVHSTSANNPKISRYVPAWDDPNLQKCVHAFIGKLSDGSIGTVQTLPWNFRGLHCGTPGNNTHLGIEICEDALTDREYCRATYREAVEMCSLLCDLYGWNPTDKAVLLCHSEGHKQGIATNHADVMHWWPKHGLSMDGFRADVAALLKQQEEPELNESQVRAIAREEAAAIVKEMLTIYDDKSYERFKIDNQAYLNSLNKLAVHDWARGAWDRATAAKVFDGSMPRAELTREQAALVLDRLGLL